MNHAHLSHRIQEKQSFLCVGLDTDPRRLPVGMQANERDVLRFNRDIIEATQAYAVAYKINIAFYEAMGPQGWAILQETLHYIPEGIFTIADAKRGDIGNTAEQYARAFFEVMNLMPSPSMLIWDAMPLLHFCPTAINGRLFWP